MPLYPCEFEKLKFFNEILSVWLLYEVDCIIIMNKLSSINEIIVIVTLFDIDLHHNCLLLLQVDCNKWILQKNKNLYLIMAIRLVWFKGHRESFESIFVLSLFKVNNKNKMKKLTSSINFRHIIAHFRNF